MIIIIIDNLYVNIIQYSEINASAQTGEHNYIRMKSIVIINIAINDYNFD